MSNGMIMLLFVIKLNLLILNAVLWTHLIWRL